MAEVPEPGWCLPFCMACVALEIPCRLLSQVVSY